MNSDGMHQEILYGYRNKATVFVYWSMCAFVVLASVIYFIWGDWQSAVSTFLIFVLMLMPTIAKGRYGLYLPFSLDLWIVAFIFFSLFVGTMVQFYDKIPIFDKLLHFQSGLLIGGTGYLLVYMLNEHEKTQLNISPGFVSVFAVVFAMAMGVVWEIFEFTYDSVSHSTLMQGVGVSDTMFDLIGDSLGAVVVGVAGYFWMHRYKRLPFTPWFFRMVRKKLEDMKSTQLESRLEQSKYAKLPAQTKT